ncbi:MAG: cation:proton antiporter [Candidatus Cloacimonetes bacterium HGW-Cloacimonetes-3]|jgi:multicomponent Na+:H+ antiporter subunit C|nr:MAG: cation:proton antiporter [Candidatus Cloacimonetes bacterium HGW-Cloacimonetes-3]
MLVLISGVLLIIIGIWAMLTRKNIIRIIIGFSIVDTGVHMIIVAIGYIKNATAPIIDSAVNTSSDISGAVHVNSLIVDPVPSALVLTAIVIGLAVTALLLSFAIRLYKVSGSLNIDDYEELKW